MHIIVDLHGLPGGQNGLDNQGRTGTIDWWYNSTNMAYTMTLIDRATDFIIGQPNTNQFTLCIINEPLAQSFYFFGQTPDSFAYLVKYYNAAIKRIRAKTSVISIMLSDGFSGPQTWDQWFANSTDNIVFDTHIYFFSGGAYSYDAPYSACYLAKSYQQATNTVFVGKWSLQAGTYNTADVTERTLFFETQMNAYQTLLNGQAFWNGKHFGDQVVGTDGSLQPEYWSWQQLASEGIVPKPGAKSNIKFWSVFLPKLVGYPRQSK